MPLSRSILWHKITSRFRQQGAQRAVRHYVARAKRFIYQVVYDWWLDRLERVPTGSTYIIREDEILGPVPPPAERLYQAFPRLPFLWSIEALGIDPAAYSFVDYGSGRGRLILTAGWLPFRRIIGVEFARSLHNEACENIAHYPRDRLACHNIESLNLNAIDFDLPDGNVVAFFNNPFTGIILDRVAQRIEDACRTSSRSVYLIFVNSNHASLFAGRPAFRRFTPNVMRRIWLAAMSTDPVEFYAVGP
jgi:hypothetical protein